MVYWSRKLLKQVQPFFLLASFSNMLAISWIGDRKVVA